MTQQKKVTTTTTTVTTVTEVVPAVRKTYVALVLDRSGSMGTMQDQAISLFNEQLQTIKNAPAEAGESLVTLVTFASIVENPIRVAQPTAIQPLNRATYHPGGSTAMYDGMGQAINLLSQYDKEGDDVAFLVVTITDGQENASREFTGAKLSEMIRRLKATGRWTFTVAGANINVDALATTLNIEYANVMAFNADTEGFQTMSASTSRGLNSYYGARAAGAQASSTFYNNDSDGAPTT